MGQSNALEKPSRLEQARLRVDSALTDLESALVKGGKVEAFNTSDQLTFDLKEENKTLKHQNQNLSDLNQRIASRLESIIKRLKDAARS